MHYYVGPISKITIILSLSFLLKACGSTGLKLGEPVRDSDWNISFLSNCPLPHYNSIHWVSEGDSRYMRFSLSDGDKGGCSTDRMSRHRAPYWERAELKQVGVLKKNSSYTIDTTLRFVEGFDGYRESFFQIHAYNKNCKQAYPPIMLKFDRTYTDDAVLTLAALNKSKRHSSYRSSWRIDDVIGRWINMKISLKTAKEGSISVSMNGEHVFSDVPFWSESCGTPHIKFGVYRPGSESGNSKSIVEFDSIIVN